MRVRLTPSPLSLHCAAVVGFGLLARTIFAGVILVETPEILLPELAAQTSPPLYEFALAQHLLEYLWFNHTLPVLAILYDALSFAVVPSDHRVLAQVVVIGFADSCAAGFVCLALLRFGVNRWLATVAGLVLSLRLVAWDLWAPPASWDIFNPLLIAMLAWSIARLRAPVRPTAFVVPGLCGALLSASFQPGPLVAVAILLPMAWAASAPSIRLSSIAVALAPMVFVAGVLVLKNGFLFGVYAPTTGAGQNIIQNLNLSLPSENDTGALEFAERLGYPEWWLWCYREAERLDFFQQKNIGGFYGTCMLSPQGFTFERVITHLRAAGERELAAVASADEIASRERPWLLSGPVVERVTRLSAAYGAVSSRLLGDTIAHMPRVYVSRTLTNLRYFISEGSEYGLNKRKPRIRAPASVDFFDQLLAPLVRLAMLTALAMTAIAPLWLACHAAAPTISAPPIEAWIISSMGVGFAAGAFASAGFHCCENYRHAFAYLPLVTLMGTLVAWYGWRAMNRRFARMSS